MDKRSWAGINKGEKNGMFAGNQVGFFALHRYVRTRLPKPKLCPNCSQEKRLDLANISNTFNPETYTRDVKNWEWLCRKCHMTKDGRITKRNNQGRFVHAV